MSRPPKPPAIRCAIYTRKSTEEGLDLEFNSLDAQRESGEAYIQSQRNEGWIGLPDRYDDGGFSGGTLERPALRQLLSDIDAGRIDCVVVYKVDRLSRSLLDFARIMETFDRRGVSFVSVTQQFNTTHSMGRLTLNILLSFAQFEREIIGERIRDKIAAQKRRGKWAGGKPVLGYDVDRSGPSPKLVVHAAEAGRVREIFALYRQHGALLPVVAALRDRGWNTKSWTTRRGKPLGGQPFDKGSLYCLLTNPVYVGKVRHKDQAYDGEHAAILEEELWAAVQVRLKQNGRDGGVEVRNRHGALLKGLLHCHGCGRAMTHSFAESRGRRYRYYTCTRAIKEGYARCPAPSLPAAEIERVVVEQVRGIAEDRGLRKEVLEHLAWKQDAAGATHKARRQPIETELRRCEGTLRKRGVSAQRKAEIENRIRGLEDRLKEFPNPPSLAADTVHEALQDFDAVWAALSPREQVELLKLLVTRVEYDAAAESLSVTFHDTGIRTPGTAS